jgi:hypothetical protein
MHIGFFCHIRGESIIGTENRVQPYYINTTHFFGAETVDLWLTGYLAISTAELRQPSIKSLCNKTFKLNPVIVPMILTPLLLLLLPQNSQFLE